MKTLKDFTREDFNKHFPIRLEDHNPRWKSLFEKEKALIVSNVNKDFYERIEHFGSTSIPGIKAKPYIDIIIGIPEEKLFDATLITQFEAIGYAYFKVPEREGIAAYMSFGKGYVIGGEKEQIFHIHMCPLDNFMWKQIAFRDYLIANPERAKAYEKLKIELVEKFSNDRGQYVLNKTDFVKETIQMIEG